MSNNSRKPLKTGLLVAVLLISALVIFGTIILQEARGLIWSAPLQVPTEPTSLVIEPTIAEDPIGRVWVAYSNKTIGGFDEPEIWFKAQNTIGTWRTPIRVTNNAFDDKNAYLTSLSNGTMLLVWSSNNSGNSNIVYRRYVSFSPVDPVPVQLTSHVLSDSQPVAVQDRNGRIWVVWQREDLTVIPVASSDIFYKYYDGVSWSQDFPFPLASSPLFHERSPSITQTKDGRVWISWSSDEGGQNTYELFYTTTDGTVETLPSTGIPSSAWAPRTALTSNTKDEDSSVLVQARDGTVHVFFQRDSGTDGDILTKSSLDNGATWGTASNVVATQAHESFPAARQMTDNRVWVVWNRQGDATKEIWYSTSDPITGVHDVGVSGLAVAPSFLRQGDTLRVNVTVTNYGDFPETTTLTVKMNNTVVTTTILSLADGEARLIQIDWTSTWGRYVPSASVTTVSGETVPNRGDNTRNGSLVRVTPLGDVDFDGDVDILDAAALAFAFGTSPGSPLWNPNADINGDNVIDILDAAQLAFYYGKSV